MPLNMKSTINKSRGTIEKFSLNAPNLIDSVRTVRVYLPPNYQIDTDKHYPVLYMHDGQNLFFNRDTKYKVGAWQVHLALDKFYENNNKGYIVVGVDSSSKYRHEELSLLPVRKKYSQFQQLSPQGVAYSHFLTTTLKAHIDEHYRTNRNLSYIGGSSMGGISSLILALKHPDLYKGALCLTPAGMLHYQKDLKALFSETIAKMQANNTPLPKLYFMVGGIGLEEVIKPFCDFAVPLLTKFGYEYGKNITYLYKKNYHHNEKAWVKVFPSAFAWMVK